MTLVAGHRPTACPVPSSQPEAFCRVATPDIHPTGGLSRRLVADLLGWRTTAHNWGRGGRRESARGAAAGVVAGHRLTVAARRGRGAVPGDRCDHGLRPDLG